MKRTLLAGFIAPLAPAFIMMPDGGSVLSLGYAYFLSGLFGIPTVWLLKKLKQESHWLYGLIGFVTAAGWIVVPALFNSDTLTPHGLLAGTLFGALGLITALGFSFIQGRKSQKSKDGTANLASLRD